MASNASPARLVIALSVAAVLAVFLLYTSIAGGNPSIAPSELRGRAGEVQLAGLVVGPVVGDAHAGGLRFRLRDIRGRSQSTTVAVRYTGSVPDLFKVGRHIVIDGRLRNGVFVAEPGSMITKCPSKYAPKRSGESA